MAITYDASLRTIDTADGPLVYHEAGEGDPLILLHGSGIGVTGWRNYRGNIGTFAEHFHTYVLEFPGFGVSHPIKGHPVLAAIESVSQFMDALRIDSTALVGNSMGAVAAANLAIHAPQRVTALVTIGGIGANLFSAAPTEGVRLLAEFADAPSRDGLVRWLRAMVTDQGLVTDELIEERWQAAQEPTAAATLTGMYSSEAQSRQQRHAATAVTAPYWSMLHRVTCPTLLTWGRDDRVSPLDMALIPMRAIPHAEMHVFPCGHWTMTESKDAFERTVIDFLDRC